MNSNRPTVLILASDPAFSRAITAQWPQDHAPNSDVPFDAPEFIVLDHAFSRDLQGSNYDLAIADASSDERRKHKGENDGNEKGNSQSKDQSKDQSRVQSLKNDENDALMQSLAAAGKPAIVIHSDPSLDFYISRGAVLELRREPGIWPALAGLIGREILCRRRAESRAREAGTLSAAAQAEATLGRYMVEMRTNVNNVLTTVLGNAELMGQEPGLPANVLAQADTIRNMTLRLHEVFQRFSSLEKELRIDKELSVAARESGKKAAHAGAGRS